MLKHCVSPHASLVGLQNGAAAPEQAWQSLKRSELSHDPALPLPGGYPREPKTCAHKRARECSQQPDHADEFCQ